MRKGWISAALLLGFLTSSTAHAGVHWSIGVRLGFPCCGPCYGPPAYYYRPVYVAPAPAVIVQPAPVTYVSAPAAPTYVATPTAAPATPVVARAARPDDEAPGLSSPDEAVRARAAVEAGRHRARAALGQLVRLLREDASAQVRESAARGLGLIADPASLAALQQAAQADDDREVRHSAAFAADVIRTNLRR
jgi:hypothetical protein